VPNGDRPGDAHGERVRARLEALGRERADALKDLEELEDADWDETSEVLARTAADAAARTAKRLSRPDSDPPSEEQKPPSSVFHRQVQKHGAPKVVGTVTAALLGLAGAIAALVQALQQAGVIK
jgi:hypothetical protein